MVNPNRLVPLVVVTLLLAVAGCGQSGSSPDDPASPAIPTPGAIPDDVPRSLVTAVLEDAATRTGTPAAEIVVVHAEAVTWNDGSLGCPEPDMGYTQALVEGYQVIVFAAGQSLDYRAGDAGRFRVCETPAE
jgi:hypothetical protein